MKKFILVATTLALILGIATTIYNPTNEGTANFNYVADTDDGHACRPPYWLF